MARALRDLDKALDQVTLKGQIVDLMDKLQDVRSALQDARDSATEKDAEIARLADVLTKRQETVTRNGFRYSQDPEDATKPVGAPFCLRCDEVDHRLIRSINNPTGSGVICPQCKTTYGRGATQFLWPEQR